MNQVQCSGNEMKFWTKAW